jgi:HSP20 family protein
MTQTLDATIERVENLYESVTGRKAPALSATPFAAIPPEKDPDTHVGEQIERLLNSLAQVVDRPISVPSWAPPVWASYAADALQIQIDLPGVPREALRLRLASGYLQVSGLRPFPTTEGTRGSQFAEQRFGAFQRTIPIPADVSAEQVRAELRDGVLIVQMPRAEAPVLEGRDIVVS